MFVYDFDCKYVCDFQNEGVCFYASNLGVLSKKKMILDVCRIYHLHSI